MESELENPQMALLGLAILSAIPVVIFALWADYFEKYLHRLNIKDPQFDAKIELGKIRTAGLFVMLSELSLFLSSTQIRDYAPTLCFLIFCTAAIGQTLVQAGLEKKLTPPSTEKNSDNLLELAARAALSWIVGVSLHILILYIFLRSASFLAEKSSLSELPSLVLLILGGVVGLVSGLYINFALSPFHFRRMLPSSPLNDPDVSSHLEKCFQKAGVKPPAFWIIELSQVRIVSVISVGFRTGIGPFRPAFFICRPALATLSTPELEAVFMNEISHIVLNHSQKRFRLTSTLILITAIISLLVIVIGQQFLPRDLVLELFAPIIAFMSFMSSLVFLSNQHKNQELEGDIYTIEKLGIMMHELTNALRKLDASILASQNSLGFPETERRIMLLQEHFQKRTDTSASQQDETDKAA